MRAALMLLLVTLLGTSSTVAGQTYSENLARCNAEGIDPDLNIAGCTAVIQSGQLNDTNLSFAFNSRGIAYDSKKDYDRAIQDYTEAIRLNPSYAYAFNNRGGAYGDKKEYDRAIQDYDQAIRLNPSYALAFNNRGNAYYYKKDYDRAIQDYDQVIRLNPSFAEAFYSRGLAYDNKKDFDRAIQDFDQAIRLNPSFADAFNDRGIAYRNKKDYDRAIQDYDQAIRLNPSYADAFNNRGGAYYYKKDYDRAIQDYDQAIRLNPSDISAFNFRGYSYFYLDKFAAAQSDFTTALAASPVDAYRVLWLYLSTARDGHSARAALEANAAQVKLADWPGPVVQTYLGKMTTAQLLTAASDPDAEKDSGQHCEAYFFLGEQALIAGRRIEAKRLFQQSIDTGVTSFVEYDAAQAELKRLQAGPATGSH